MHRQFQHEPSKRNFSFRDWESRACRRNIINSLREETRKVRTITAIGPYNDDVSKYRLPRR